MEQHCKYKNIKAEHFITLNYQYYLFTIHDRIFSSIKMFFLQWFWDILTYFGFNRKGKLSIIGLDNAGKSTLLGLLADGRLVQHPPTGRPVSREMTLSGITFTTFDLGGHTQARRLWKDYFLAIDGIVFVVDAADHERFEEAKVELNTVLKDDLVSDIPVVILGNKTDKKDSLGWETMVNMLGIPQYLPGQNNSFTYGDQPDHPTRKGPCQLFMCSMLKREGYGDAFRWLAKEIKDNPDRNS